MTTRKISVEIVGDADSLERALGRSSHAASQFERHIGSAGKGALAAELNFRGLGRAAGYASAQFLGAAGFVAVLKSSIGAASDLHEQLNKVDVVFRSNAASVKKWSKDSADSMGLAQHEALAYAATFGNMLVPMGLGRDKAAAMSTEIVKLAGDMASFNNADPAKVLEALQSGLAGQVRPLREYGIFLSKARIEAVALSEGIVKADVSSRGLTEAQQSYVIAQSKANDANAKYGKGSREAAAANLELERAADRVSKAVAGHVPALTAAQKALATYKIIQQDTADAQGDFARTSGGLANQQRILRAHLADLEAEIGTALLPTVTKYTKELNAWLQKAEKSGELHRDLDKAVKVLSETVKAGGDIAHVASSYFSELSDAVGGDKHAVELLTGALIAFKARGVVAAVIGLNGIGAAAGEKGAAGKVGLLRSRLTGLGAISIAPIVIPIAISIGAKEKSWIEKHLGKGGASLFDGIMTVATGGVVGGPQAIWNDLTGGGSKKSGGTSGSSDNSAGGAGSEAAAKAAAGKGHSSSGPSSMWSGDHGGLDEGFKTKLGNCVADAGGSSIYVTSGRRSAQHNAAVGGASNSNHLTGHAADGTCVINGHTYPLGQAPMNYAKFGLRAGSTFNWGGAPDIYHVDDGTNVGGAPTSTSSNSGGLPVPESGKHSKTPAPVSGSKLLSSAARIAIANAAGTTGSADDLRAYKAARTELEKLQDTYKGKHQGHESVQIAEELAKVNKQINAIEKSDAAKVLAAKNAKLKAELKAEQRAWSDHLKVLRQLAETAHTTFVDQWSKIADKTLSAFDVATKKGFAKLQKTYADQLTAFDRETQQGIKDRAAVTQTPEEKALADFIAGRQGTESAKAKAQRQSDLSAKQQALSGLQIAGVGGVDASGNAITQGDIDAAAQAVADAQGVIDQAALDEQQAGLQTAADASRTAADKVAQDAQDAYQQQRDDLRAHMDAQEQILEDGYSNQRDIERQNLADWLDFQEKSLEAGTTQWATFFQQLSALAGSYGLDAGASFWGGWQNASNAGNASQSAATAAAAAAAGGAGAKNRAVAAVAVKVGAGVAAAAKRIPFLAAGGIATRPTVAVIGDAGPEAIVPLSRLGTVGNGTGGPVTIILQVEGREMARATRPHLEGEVVVKLR